MKISVGKGSCGIAAGADKIFDLLNREAENIGGSAAVVGCIGMCYLEPIVNINSDVYVKVDEKGVSELVKLIRGEENNAARYKADKEELALLSLQTRIALQNCGVINPESIDEYIEKGGYEAAKKCITGMTYEAVIAEIKASGLSGRGGAGFPAWFKWQACRDSAGEKKYIICNADEGDPGAFMDRAILESDPHAVLEGMITAAFAIGADEGIIYVRAEYPLAVARLEKAIEQARERGLLGMNIFGSEFCFDIHIKAGAGAFVCGEETALIASLEGERGMPRLKPPFPAQKGYRNKPSNINNVETYANVPWIIRNGGAAFSELGTDNSKGTKVFALTGKIAKGGLVEVPMGCTIRDVVHNIGGGIQGGKKFKAVQMGGPSGGCIPAELQDTEIDYKSLAETGAIMGSGGMVVMDETTCMVDIARFFLDFTCKESCGKCTHCRVGNRRLLEILERICGGKGKDGDIELLSELSEDIKTGSLCALGQTAPNPVLTTLRYFKNEYEDHIYNKKCTARSCKPLLTYTIDLKKCKKCNLCVKKCPAGAITELIIDSSKCTKCGLCADLCKFGAIEVI
ncbi:MAG: NADH-quinone oxidoreductase subunit NuoF [Oscillospiraceae bacterium]|jgi:NADH-quinone oxidoreductase subunit F|nr:NADH-quinone oxidoreductase subunit NuoF [Oscillospiraceae bacterium]